MLRCLVPRQIFSSSVISKAPLLCSNALQWVEFDTNPFSNHFLEQFQNWDLLPQTIDKAIYSTSVVDNVVCVCILDAHNIGHLVYVITQPVCDLLVVGSQWAVSGHQLPLKSTSAQQSNLQLLSGCKIL